MVMTMGTSEGSKALYTCTMGFMLEGPMMRICQSNGQWSGKTPTCECKHPLCHFVNNLSCPVPSYSVCSSLPCPVLPCSLPCPVIHYQTWSHIPLIRHTRCSSGLGTGTGHARQDRARRGRKGQGRSEI